MTNTWSNRRIINFINEVQLRPELWNVKVGKYKDRNAKKEGWTVVAEKFGISSDEAYKKFRSLRTYAKNEEKKKKSGSTGGKKTKWFAFDAISFILTKDTPNTELDSDDNNVSEILHRDISAEHEDIVDSKTTATSRSSAHVTKPRVFKKTHKPKDPIVEKTQICDAGEKRRNEYAGFGEHIANKLSKYDSYTRSLAEFKIMQILFDCDMGIYRKQDSSANTPSSDSNTSPEASTTQRHIHSLST